MIDIERLREVVIELANARQSEATSRLRQMAKSALAGTSACSGCAGITHTHTCGDPAKQPQLSGDGQ